MPIRFRCAYCNQLMGIAHRKAGTVVRCPTCSGQVVVPNPDAAGEAGGDAGGAAAPREGLFERSDFDQVFDVPGGARPPIPVPGPEAAAPVGAWGAHGDPSLDVERMDPAPFVAAPLSGPRAGVVLSSAQLTMFTVGAVLLLAAVFGAGVLVGRYLLGGS